MEIKKLENFPKIPHFDLMVDIGSLQSASTPVNGANSAVRDSNTQRTRDHIDSAPGRQSYDGIRVTAKYSDPDRDNGLRTVKGEERRAVETADTDALVAMQSRRAAAEALMSLQEVGQDQQNNPEIANAGSGPVQVAEASDSSKQKLSLGTAGINTIDKQSSLDPSSNNISSNGNAEITSPDGKTTAGNSGAPPRGSVLDIIA